MKEQVMVQDGISEVRADFRSQLASHQPEHVEQVEVPQKYAPIWEYTARTQDPHGEVLCYFLMGSTPNPNRSIQTILRDLQDTYGLHLPSFFLRHPGKLLDSVMYDSESRIFPESYDHVSAELSLLTSELMQVASEDIFNFCEPVYEDTAFASLHLFFVSLFSKQVGLQKQQRRYTQPEARLEALSSEGFTSEEMLRSAYQDDPFSNNFVGRRELFLSDELSPYKQDQDVTIFQLMERIRTRLEHEVLQLVIDVQSTFGSLKYRSREDRQGPPIPLNEHTIQQLHYELNASQLDLQDYGAPKFSLNGVPVTVGTDVDGEFSGFEFSTHYMTSSNIKQFILRSISKRCFGNENELTNIVTLMLRCKICEELELMMLKFSSELEREADSKSKKISASKVYQEHLATFSIEPAHWVKEKTNFKHVANSNIGLGGLVQLIEQDIFFHGVGKYEAAFGNPLFAKENDESENVLRETALGWLKLFKQSLAAYSRPIPRDFAEKGSTAIASGLEILISMLRGIGNPHFVITGNPLIMQREFLKGNISQISKATHHQMKRPEWYSIPPLDSRRQVLHLHGRAPVQVNKKYGPNREMIDIAELYLPQHSRITKIQMLATSADKKTKIDLALIDDYRLQYDAETGQYQAIFSDSGQEKVRNAGGHILYSADFDHHPEAPKRGSLPLTAIELQRLKEVADSLRLAGYGAVAKELDAVAEGNTRRIRLRKLVRHSFTADASQQGPTTHDVMLALKSGSTYTFSPRIMQIFEADGFAAQLPLPNQGRLEGQCTHFAAIQALVLNYVFHSYVQDPQFRSSPELQLTANLGLGCMLYGVPHATTRGRVGETAVRHDASPSASVLLHYLKEIKKYFSKAIKKQNVDAVIPEQVNGRTTGDKKVPLGKRETIKMSEQIVFNELTETFVELVKNAYGFTDSPRVMSKIKLPDHVKKTGAFFHKLSTLHRERSKREIRDEKKLLGEACDALIKVWVEYSGAINHSEKQSMLIQNMVKQGKYLPERTISLDVLKLLKAAAQYL